MITVEFDGIRLERIYTDANHALESHIPDLLELLGVKLLSLSKIDYVTKGRGGTGKDGISWKPLKPETIKQKNRRPANNQSFGADRSQIGVNTGLQLASASPGYKAADPHGGTTGNIFTINNGELTIGYGRSYSVFFDRIRKLLPDSLPTAWADELDAIAVDWGYKTIQPVFDQL